MLNWRQRLAEIIKTKHSRRRYLCLLFCLAGPFSTVVCACASTSILSTMSEKRAIATLTGAVLLSTLTIWAVHFQQHQEREVISNATVSLSNLTILESEIRPCTKVFSGMTSEDKKRCDRERKILQTRNGSVKYMSVSRQWKGHRKGQSEVRDGWSSFLATTRHIYPRIQQSI